MNRLWVWLALAFAAVIASAAVLVLVAAARADRRGAEERAAEHRALVEALATRYARAGDWEGVDEALALARALPHGARARPAPAMVLRDADGSVIYRGGSTEGGARPAAPHAVPDAALPRPLPAAARLPIVVEGARVGTLELLPPRADAAPGADATAPLQRDLLRLVLIAALLGLGASVLLSRALTRPLERVVAAAADLAAGRWERRVPETGSAETRAVARAFNEMAGALQDGERQRKQMVADVAHELRTPLSVLQGSLQAILDGVFPLARVEVESLAGQARALSGLVDDLHALSLAEAGALRLELRPLDPRALLRELAAAFEPLADAQEVSLALDAPAEIAPLPLDEARMRQALHNLLSNALRHTPPGGRVTLGAADDGRTVALWVADTGEGIPPRELERIFERFHRTDDARARDRGGSGLGLAIARAIVEAQGGRIRAESEGPGRGARILVELPRSPAPTPAPTPVR